MVRDLDLIFGHQEDLLGHVAVGGFRTVAMESFGDFLHEAKMSDRKFPRNRLSLCDGIRRKSGPTCPT